MMNGYYGNVGWGGWLAMALIMIAFWGLVVYAVVALFRGGAPSSRSGSTDPADPTDPRRILDERLARGDIQVEEYQSRKDALVTTTRT
jgi:putative membrane protein